MESRALDPLNVSYPLQVLAMSVFILKISGVGISEPTIEGRQASYPRYVRRTNTFFPGPQKALA